MSVRFQRFFACFLGFLAVAILNAPIAQAAPERIAMSNGLTFPYTLLKSPNYVRHYQKLRTVPSNGDARYSNIELTYVNFVEIMNGELTDYRPFTIQAEILYGGVYYPVTFNGQKSAVLNGGESVVGKVAGLSLPAGAQFYERVRQVGSSSGTQSYIMSHGARRVLLEGAIGDTNTAVNFLGGKEGHGATCAFNIQSGRITSATLKSPGVNYTNAAIIAAFDPTTQTEATIGYADQSGGRTTAIVITNGGAGFSNQTKCVVTGGGGFGIDAEIYASAMITGIPNVEGLESLLIVGDSIARGYGSTDSRGDAMGNYGIFERAVGSRYATATTAIPGNLASAYKNVVSHKRMHAIVLPYVTHALINLGTNDLAMNASASDVAKANVQTAAELRKAGIKVSFATVIPRVSGSFTTLGGQTAVAGFTAGGAADTYNAWVRGGTNGLTSDWGMIDARAVYKDATWQNKWRVDSAMTDDGVHPNGKSGIPFGAAQLAARFGDLASRGTGSTSATTISSYTDDATLNLAPTITTVDVHGTHVTVNGGAASYTLSATTGGNTVNTGSGNATLNVGGVYTKINLGAGKTWINDEGTYNIIRLPPAGGGIATISGKIFQKGTRLDLRPLLASTTWKGDTTSLSRYLKVWISEDSAFLIVTPTGNGGQSYLAANLTSYDSLSLSTLLGNAMIGP